MADYVLQLKNINKYFGKNHVIKNVNLNFEKGHFITFLGPSGCGKTTLLRMIAGFYEPDEGEILLNGKNIEKVPPYDRNTAMVFQEYALFPHMNVFDNVSYGLRVKKKSKDEIEKRVKQALALMQLEGMEKRFPNQMSGGQQQRVAVARALVQSGCQTSRKRAGGTATDSAENGPFHHLRHPRSVRSTFHVRRYCSIERRHRSSGRHTPGNLFRTENRFCG